MGSVESVMDHDGGRRLVLSASVLSGTAIGASIAVNGVCLTAVEVDGSSLTVDVINETLSRSNLGRISDGDSVNLERPLTAGGRLDGHIVQGHVDGLGTVESMDQSETGSLMTISAPESILRYLVEKGSITVDGVSLTVAGLGRGSFSAALIPHTLEATNLGLRKPGDLVNLEIDILAKYVERLLQVHK